VKRTIFVFAGVLACCGILPAQNPIAENQRNYEAIKSNIMKSAEKMPAEAYSFQATPEERTWAALMGHIADAQTRMCSSAEGSPKPANAGKLTSKDDLVKALGDSFTVCDAAWSSTTEENAHAMAKMGNREMSRISLLIYNTTHDNESYGTMAVYMRLKGVVPPSSEKR
jgi:uncharacterized damage-inducible protein DinB